MQQRCHGNLPTWLLLCCLESLKMSTEVAIGRAKHVVHSQAGCYFCYACQSKTLSIISPAFTFLSTTSSSWRITLASHGETPKSGKTHGLHYARHPSGLHIRFHLHSFTADSYRKQPHNRSGALPTSAHFAAIRRHRCPLVESAVLLRSALSATSTSYPTSVAVTCCCTSPSL